MDDGMTRSCHSISPIFNVPYLINDPFGTAKYTAPEIMVGSDYSFGVDFWSLGIDLYELLFEELPWVADNNHDLVIPDDSDVSDIHIKLV
jgi:serine/threonine protein kinase